MNGRGYCSVPCCYQEIKQRGLCKTHLSRFYRTGGTDRIKVENKGTLCRAEKCNQPAKKMGHCLSHYLKLRRYGKLDAPTDKRSHVHYMLWWARRKSGTLCPEWLDFWVFAKDIGDRPSKKHFLMPLRPNEPFSPSNFQWHKKLFKRPEETTQEWHARKWASRMAAFPSFDRERKFLSRYGISLEQYNEMLAGQDGKCAICEEVETQVDGKTGTLKQLAVDHCHNSNKVRGLLCVRCNTTLGKLEESPQLIRAMWDYLHKHATI